MGKNFAVESLVLGSLSILSGVFGGIVIAVWRYYSERLPDIESEILPVIVSCVATSIILLGPGAISVDARLFGRREIVIPKSTREHITNER